MIDVAFSNFQELDNGIPLAAGTNGQGFRVVKGNLYQDVGGSTAPITVDGVGAGSAYHVPDVAFITTGSLILRNQGVLQYTGAAAAALAKDFSIDGACGLRATGGGTLTVAGIISESSAGASLAVGGAGESFVLTANNTYTGPTYIPESTVSVSTLPNGGVAGPLGKSTAAPANLEIDGGVLRYTGATATTDRGFTVTESLATIDVTTAANNLTFTGQVVGIGALTKAGPGTLTLTNPNLTYANKTNVYAGKLALATNLTSSSSIYASGTLELSTGGGSNRVIKTQSVATGNSTGKIDLKDNKLILTAQPVGSWNGSAYGGVTQLIQSGRNGGAWDGDGIVTSMTAATGGNTLTSLAVASNADLGYATFGGVSVGATDTLVMYTYTGDANPDGVINGDDYFQIDSAFPQLLHGWMNGDFDYDGTINGDDYFLTDSNFSAQGAPFPTSAGLADSVTMVPEPALALTAVAVIIFAPQRRRRGRGPG